MEFYVGPYCTVLYLELPWKQRPVGHFSSHTPVYVGPLRKAPIVCKVCVFTDGAWQLLVTAHVSPLGESGAVCLYYST